MLIYHQNSDSTKSEIPIIVAEGNERGSTENNEELETDKENTEPGISNIDSTEHFEDRAPETNLDAILLIPSASVVRSARACSKQFAAIFTSPAHITK
ncbi:hypothetical protein Trydic_g8900 [Trypoxylus dichotomus]